MKKSASSRGTTPSRSIGSSCRSLNSAAAGAAPACGSWSGGTSTGSTLSGGGPVALVATTPAAGVGRRDRPADGQQRTDHVSNASGQITCQRQRPSRTVARRPSLRVAQLCSLELGTVVLRQKTSLERCAWSHKPRLEWKGFVETLHGEWRLHMLIHGGFRVRTCCTRFKSTDGG